MSTQKKLSTVTLSAPEKAKIGAVLDLEKKYFNILWELFTSDAFTNDLKSIEGEIQKQYEFLQNRVFPVQKLSYGSDVPFC